MVALHTDGHRPIYVSDTSKRAIARQNWFDYLRAIEDHMLNLRRAALSDQPFCREIIDECTWHLLFAQMRGPVPMCKGSSTTITGATLSMRFASCKDMLAAQFEEVVRCRNRGVRAVRVYEFMLVCRRILDPAGVAMDYQMFRFAFSVDEVTQKQMNEIHGYERDHLVEIGFVFDGEKFHWPQ